MAHEKRLYSDIRPMMPSKNDVSNDEAWETYYAQSAQRAWEFGGWDKVGQYVWSVVKYYKMGVVRKLLNVENEEA